MELRRVGCNDRHAMKYLRTDNLAMRIGGTVMGLGFLALGVFALVGMRTVEDVVEADRLLWFGITAVFGGVSAIGFAWLEPRLDQVFCAPPRRWLGGFLRRKGGK